MRNLSEILRPKKLEDFIGQDHLFSTDSPLFSTLKGGGFPHSFFYGPPGSGKTTLARIIAYELNQPFLQCNGVDFKLDDLRKQLKTYQNTLIKPVIFIDEAHRLNKMQQEFFLPIMESYSAIILGASTQNPFYTLTQALRSRSILCELFALESKHLQKILDKALRLYPCNIDTDAKTYLVDSSNGDARAMLHLLDLFDKQEHITLEMLKSIRPYFLHQGSSEDNAHYNLISAMIKSIRGSDPDAGIYYLAKLIAGGESAEFIARRLVILASEDIGNANPNALNLATSTLLAVSKIGYPEARILLSQCVIYLASSPKSNTAYKAIDNALNFVKNHRDMPTFKHLLPNAKNYLYPHHFGGWVEQDYNPTAMKFVEQTKKGFEKNLQEWLDKIRQK